MSEQPRQNKVNLNPAQETNINKMAGLISSGIDQCELTNGEHLALLVVLCCRYVQRSLASAPEGCFTVEHLADSVRESIVRTWRLTSRLRDQ